MTKQNKSRKPLEQRMGAHWKETGSPPLYQLYRRVETVASHLERRRKRGWAPGKTYIHELYDISIQLKMLDMRMKDQSGEMRCQASPHSSRSV